MDQQFDFRVLLIKLQDCLSDNDRRRLHFIVGDTIPRYLRDDPTLGGTLSLLESLFDQAKISEQDFDYLIHTFNEIHCYEAVKRLKEHQLAQHERKRIGTSRTNISDLFADNELDKISPNPTFSNFTSSDNFEILDSTSNQATTTKTSFDQQNVNKNKLLLTKSSIQFETKENKKSIKQSFKSRLTTCQFILLILNFIGIITFIILIAIFAKSKQSIGDILLFKAGTFYGNIAGGDRFNDAQDCSLTFNDRIMNINAGWTSDTLEFIMFGYSNGKTEQHCRQLSQYSLYTSTYNLDPDESINGVTVYTGTRLIVNPYSPNGSYLVVGLCFSTTKGQSTQIFGSSNGTLTDEIIPGFTIGYLRGKALGYVDALQFIWYKTSSSTGSAVLSIY